MWRRIRSLPSCLKPASLLTSAYNPISSATDAGGADATAAAVDALGAQMQATINALGAMLEGVSGSNSADPHSDAVDAMVAAINSAGAAGTSIDFGSVTNVTSILNQSRSRFGNMSLRWQVFRRRSLR